MFTVRGIRPFVVGCIPVIAWPFIATADVIVVSGDVSGTWSADTVLVTGEIRIPPSETLVIEPGVEVLFQVYCKFIVDSGAALMAVGNQTDSIRMDTFYPGSSWHGIRFYYASSASRLEYCLLRNGQASGNMPDLYGGGVYCYYSSPAISHCLIENCRASSGGGVYLAYSNSTISDCLIRDNMADYSAGGIHCHCCDGPLIVDNTICGNIALYEYGGGIYCSSSSSEILRNVFGQNLAASGGGIACDYCDPSISDNSFDHNTALIDGGGIFCRSASPTISGNSFSGNSADCGGGVHCYLSSDPLISNNLFSYHSASSDGGAICCWDGPNPTLVNNTMVSNCAGDDGGGIYCIGSSPAILNGIFRDNTPDQIHPYPDSHPSVTYCDVQGGWTGMGNFDADPLFVAGPEGFYYLSQLAAGQPLQSPCVDAGDPSSPLIDGTTRTDGLPDAGVVDLGYHYPTLVPYAESASVEPCDFHYSLGPVYPSPFNLATIIRFQLPTASLVRLEVFDISGRTGGAHSATPLIDGWLEAGDHQIAFDGLNLASGIYIYRLMAGDYSAAGKMVLVK